MNEIYQIVRWEDVDCYPKPQYAVTDLHDDNEPVGALVPVDIDVEAGMLALCIYRDPEADDHDHIKPCKESIAMFTKALEAAIQS